MIEKIINGKNDIENLYCEIYENKSARLLFLFYFYHRKYKTDDIVDKIIELEDYHYLHFLIRIIDEKYYDKLLTSILNCNDAKTIYYVAFDTKKLNMKHLNLLLDKLIQLNDKKYLLLFINYFLFVRKYNDLDIKTKINSVLKSYNLNIITLKEEDISKIMVEYVDISSIEDANFSSNCYKDRKIIPDMIVCHICNNYEKAIKTFYDPHSEVSAHFVIARDGRVKQIVSLDDCAWANGTSVNDTSNAYYKFSTNDIIRNRKINANYYTFSIEHESFDGSLTDIQYKNSLEIIKKIIKYMKDKYNYDFIIDTDHLIGHNNVNPIVKPSCPGEYFPLVKMISDLKRTKI